MRKVIFDIDGVIADCIAPIVTAINVVRRNGGEGDELLSRDDITCFNFMDPREKILTEWECLFAKELFASRGFALSLGAIPGAADLVTNIIRMKEVYEVIFVTSQWVNSETWCHDRYKWMCNLFGDKNVKNKLVFAQDKSLVHADVFIDDKIENCFDYKEAHPESRVILVRQPWNKRVKCLESNKLLPIADHKDIADAILYPEDYLDKAFAYEFFL